ncbi:hypothetical protein SEVIR_4G208550v4 [Setaria viridis]
MMKRAYPDLNQPLDDEELLQQQHNLDGAKFAGGQQLIISSVDGGEGSAYLPDLNEQPANEEEFLQIHETQQGINLVNDLDIVFEEEELENSTDEEDEHANGSAQTRSKELTATQRK